MASISVRLPVPCLVGPGGKGKFALLKCHYSIPYGAAHVIHHLHVSGLKDPERIWAAKSGEKHLHTLLAHTAGGLNTGTLEGIDIFRIVQHLK